MTDIDYIWCDFRLGEDAFEMQKEHLGARLVFLFGVDWTVRLLRDNVSVKHEYLEVNILLLL